jgi:uncharacterized protein (TIGR02118 family)
MAKMMVLYGKPSDAQAFDAYYAATHVPLAKKIPGLRRFETSSGPVAAADGTQPYHLVATLEFDTPAALQQGLASPEGRAAAADVPNFADGGVQLFFFETKTV